MASALLTDLPPLKITLMKAKILMAKLLRCLIRTLITLVNGAVHKLDINTVKTKTSTCHQFPMQNPDIFGGTNGLFCFLPRSRLLFETLYINVIITLFNATFEK